MILSKNLQVVIVCILFVLAILLIVTAFLCSGFLGVPVYLITVYCLFLVLMKFVNSKEGEIKMFNPFQYLVDIKEKQEALIKHLGLKSKLVPRHWLFEKEKKTKQVKA